MPDTRSGIYPTRTYKVASGNLTSSGDTTIISADGDARRIWIVSIFIVNNDDANADVALQEPSSATNVWPKTMLPAYGGQLDPEIPGTGFPIPTRGAGVDLNIANAGASPDVSYVIFYFPSEE